MEDRVRSVWVHSLHECAFIRFAMEAVTGMHLTASSEQHADLSASRIKRDTKDLDKVVQWLTAHKPFSVTDVRVCNLALLNVKMIILLQINLRRLKQLFRTTGMCRAFLTSNYLL